MASDLKMEIFAFNLFHNLWYTYNVTEILPDVLEVYKDECNRVNDLMEALDIQFDPVIFVRRLVFKNIYRNFLTDELIESLKSPLDCYEYVHRICDLDDFFDYPTVFQRMFATITFVLILCLRMDENGHNIDIVKYGHLFWVMYFDKFTEVFYKYGGWKALQEEAKSYGHLFEFDNTFNKCMFKLLKIKQATINFFLSKNAVQCEEQKHERPTHFSKLWIKFCIKNFESYVKVPLSYEIFMSSSDGELIIKDLKLILVHSRPTFSDVKLETENHQASTIPTAISIPELHYAPDEKTQANDAGVQLFTFEKNGINNKVHEKTQASDAGVQPITFEQNRFIDKSHEETQARDGGAQPITFEQSGINDTVHEETQANDAGVQPVTFKRSGIINKVPDEFLAIVSDFEKRTGTKCVISEHEVVNLDITCQNKNLEFAKDTFAETDSSKQTSSLNSTKNSSTEQNLLPGVNGKKLSETSTEKLANASDSGPSCKRKSFTNKCENGKTVNVFKENTERRDKIAVTGHVTFVDKMVENISPENVSSLTDSSPERENVGIDGKKKTIKSKEDLRNEQNDPNMKLFFQMLLVLGDKEETQSVLSKLQNNEGGPEKSQKSSKKKKKKSKKKSGNLFS